MPPVCVEILCYTLHTLHLQREREKKKHIPNETNEGTLSKGPIKIRYVPKKSQSL